MSSAAIQAGKAVITVGLDPKGVDRGISDMSHKLKGLSNAFREVGFEVTALSGAISYGLVRALKLLDRPLRISAHIESATISFEVLTGSARMAIDTVKELRAFAAVSPLKFEGLAQASETLLAYGVSARRVVKDIKLLGQVSRGDQTRLTRLSLAYGQVAAKGRLYASEMRQFTESGFNPLQIMVEKTGKTMGMLLKEMESGKVRFEDVRQAFIDATSAGGRFFGLLQKQSQSLGGYFFRMVDAIEQALQPIGDALAKPLKEIMRSIMEVAREMRTFLIANHNLVRGIVGGTLVLTVFSAAVTGVGISLLAIGAAGRIFSTVLKTLSYFSKVSFKATAAQLGSVTVAANDMSAGVVTAATEASAAIKVLDKSIKSITVGMAVEMKKLEVVFVKGFAKSSLAVKAFATTLTAQSIVASTALTRSLGASFDAVQPTIKAAMLAAGESYSLGWDRIHVKTAIAATKLENGLANVFKSLGVSVTASMKLVTQAYVAGWAEMIKFSPTGGSLLVSSFRLHVMGLPAAIVDVMKEVSTVYVTGWASLVKHTPVGGNLLSTSFKLQVMGLPAIMTEVMDVVATAYVSGWGLLVKHTPVGGALLVSSFKLQLMGLPAIVKEVMEVCRLAYVVGWEKVAASSAAGGKILNAAFTSAFKGIAAIVNIEMATINLSVVSSVELLGRTLISLVTATNMAIAAKTAELQMYAATLRGIVLDISGLTAAATTSGGAVAGAAKATTKAAPKSKKGLQLDERVSPKPSNAAEIKETAKAHAKAKAKAETAAGRTAEGVTTYKAEMKKLAVANRKALDKSENKPGGQPGAERGEYKLRKKGAVEKTAEKNSKVIQKAAEDFKDGADDIKDVAKENASQATEVAPAGISTTRRKRGTGPKGPPGLRARLKNLRRRELDRDIGGVILPEAASGIVPASPNRIRPGFNAKKADRRQREAAELARREAEAELRGGRVTINAEKERRRELARKAEGRAPATIPRRPGPNFVPYKAPNAMIPFDPAFAAKQQQSMLGLASVAALPYLLPGGRDDVQAMREERAAARAARGQLETFRTSGRSARNRPDVEFPSQRATEIPYAGGMMHGPMTRNEARRARIRERLFGTGASIAGPTKAGPSGPASTNPRTLEKQRRREAAANEMRRRNVNPEPFRRGQKERRVAAQLASVPRRRSVGQRVGGALAGMVDPRANLAATKRLGAAAGGGILKVGGKVGGAVGGAGKSLLAPFTMMGGMLKALLVPAGIFAAKFTIVAVIVAGIAALFIKVAKDAGVLNDMATGLKSTFASVYGWVSQVVTTLFKAAKMGEIGTMLSYAFAEAKFGFLVFVQSMFQLLPKIVEYGSKLFIALGKTIYDIFAALPGMIWGALTGGTKISMEVFTSMFTGNLPGAKGGAIDSAVKTARTDADSLRAGINTRSSEKDAKASAKAANAKRASDATEAENTRKAEEEEAAVRDAAENARLKGLSDSGVNPVAFGKDPSALVESQKSAKDRVKALVDENVAIYQAARGNKNYLDVINGVSSAMIAASQSATDLNEALKAGEKLNERIKDAQSSTFAVFDGGGALQERKAAMKAIFDADQKNLQLRKEAVALAVVGSDPANQSAEFSKRQRVLNDAIASTAGSSQTARNNFLKLNEALRAEAILVAADAIKSLSDDIESLVLGADAAERLKRQREGLNEAELNAIDALKQQKKLLEDRAAADEQRKERATEIKESLKTPIQQFKASQQEVADLQRRGFLSQEEAAQAFAQNIQGISGDMNPNIGQSGFTTAKPGSAAAREARRNTLLQLQEGMGQLRGKRLASMNAAKAGEAKNEAVKRDVLENRFRESQLAVLGEIRDAVTKNTQRMAIP